MNDNILVQDDSQVSSDSAVPSEWIKIEDGLFVCSECENESAPETNTIEGTVTANINEIKADLEQYPTKVVYATCPVCGMEYVFKLHNNDLYLEPSDLEK